MTKQKGDMNDIPDQLNKLGRQRWESYLTLMGVDIKKVRQLGKKFDGQYEALCEKVRQMMKNSGKENAELHRKSLERVRLMTQLISEKAFQSALKPFRRGSLVLQCCPIYTAPVVDTEDSVITTGGGSGSVTFDTVGNTARPYADSGLADGCGTFTSSKVTTSFKFAFTPASTRRYCIRPIVHVNGHCFLWTWGSSITFGDCPGSGEIYVKLLVRVIQLDCPVANTEHLIIKEETYNVLQNQYSFAYDSQVDGGASLEVDLQGMHEVIVVVECESYARISDHGNAWVDMQTMPFLYFSVPEVRWGIRLPLPV